jgi:hypothetical protein
MERKATTRPQVWSRAPPFVVDVGAVGEDPSTVDLIEINSFRCAGLDAADLKPAFAALAREGNLGATDATTKAGAGSI